MRDWYIEVGGVYIIDGQSHFGRRIYIDPDDIEKQKARFKNTDVYATVYLYNHEDQNESDLYGPLYVDMDIDIKTDSDYMKIRRDLLHIVTAMNVHYAIPYEQIKIYFSGNKGFHIIVPPEVLGIQPDKNLNRYFKSIAEEFRELTMWKTVDNRIYDKKRLFRLPNTVNGKTGFYKVPVALDFVRDASYEDMLQYASSPKEIRIPEPKFNQDAARKFKEAVKRFEKAEKDRAKQRAKSGHGKPGKELLPCISKILMGGATKGNRNNTAVILASSFFQQGHSVDEVINKVIEWNTTMNSPKLPDAEVIATVRSAEVGFKAGKSYGCKATIDLGYCIGSKCNLYIKKN